MSLNPTDHILINPKICGGKPCVTGTRIRIWDIHVWHNMRGRSPAEIVECYPQLTLSQVYAALAYYLDHQQEIDSQMKEAERFVEEMQTRSGPSLIDQLRQRNLADADVSP